MISHSGREEVEIINKMIEENQGNPDVLECLRILKLGIKAEILNRQPQHLDDKDWYDRR